MSDTYVFVCAISFMPVVIAAAVLVVAVACRACMQPRVVLVVIVACRAWRDRGVSCSHDSGE